MLWLVFKLSSHVEVRPKDEWFRVKQDSLQHITISKHVNDYSIIITYLQQTSI